MIGSDLRLLRIEAGLTQVELSSRLNITQGMISRIEKGDTTASDVIERWVAACGGSIRFEGARGVSPEIAKLLNLANSLSADDLRRLICIARGLPVVHPGLKDGIVATFTALLPPETQAHAQPGNARQTAG